MKRLVTTLLFAFSLPSFVFAASLTITPESPVQGEPVMVVIEGADISDLKRLTFAGKKILPFYYKGKPTVFIPIDLAQRPSSYLLVVEFRSGERAEKTITVVAREKISAPLGIPDKLGGNTKAAQTNLVTTLTKENAALAKVKAAVPAWWGEPFRFPVEQPVIVDTYGYSRSTGSYAIAHKGTDFRAKTGTPIFAINNGVVRLAREFTVYGKTVVIDHGGGVASLSMHLSDIQVKEGQRVQKGDSIGLAGDSGYALGPHLHLSIRINGVSIDPMKFLELFQ